MKVILELDLKLMSERPRQECLNLFVEDNSDPHIDKISQGRTTIGLKSKKILSRLMMNVLIIRFITPE